MELCLGTVQFGMDYGIKGQKKPDISDCIKMLDYAVQNGITNIDTAYAYGSAEDVVGEFLNKKIKKRDEIFLISKFKPNELDNVSVNNYKKVLEENLEKSLKRLNTDYLDSYLLHSSRYAFNQEIIDALFELKKSGKIRYSGVSVYYPDEAKVCIKNEKVDFIQLPSSIFDQRMLKEGVFDLANELRSTQIHSRSAFIQGLILMNEEEVPEFLKEAKPVIRKIDNLCKKHHTSRIKLALLFVKQFKCISHLVFGVDNMEQLKENIEIFKEDFSKDIIDEISLEFQNIDTNIIMPSLWVKNN